MSSAPNVAGDDVLPSATPRYSRAAAGVAWVVIVGLIATVGYRNWRVSRGVERAEAIAEYQLVIASRMAVGSYSILSHWSGAPPTLASQLIDQVRQSAKTPADKLRAVCVIGEIDGPDAALSELDRVKPLLKSAELKRDAAALQTIYTHGPSQVPADEREALVGRHGWFGKLAISHGKSDDDPDRHKVIRRARTTFVAFVVFELVIGLGLLAGLVLLIVGIILLALGSIRPAYRPATAPRSAFLEAFAVYLAGFILTGLVVRWAWPDAGEWATWLATPAIVLAALWPRLRGVSWPELRYALGWHAGRGLFVETFAGIGAYLAGLPIIAGALIVTWVLMKRSGANAAHPIMFANTRGVWAVVQLYLLASVWAPLVEEAMFRGALFHHLRQWHGWLVTALISSLLFAALHPQGWAAIPVLGAIAFVFAAIREWRGTTFASAAAHALNNGVVVTLLVVALR